MITFRVWLLEQVNRDDFVGQLARIAARLTWQDESGLLEALLNASWRDTAFSAVEDAVFEYAIALERENYGFVYFIRAGEAGPVKIGFSRSVQTRLAALQTAHHERLVLVAKHMGTIETERELHQRFTHLRLEGEWFRVEADLLAYIASIAP